MQYSRVLVIDDDEDDQELFRLALKEITNTVECTTLTNARNALIQLETRALTTDAIFLDLNMPIMTGQQFLSGISKREALSNIPVIILSTSYNAATIKEAMALGAKCFITKPNNFRELKTILFKILE